MILCFGGGRWQQASILEAIKIGHELVIVEQEPTATILNSNIPIIYESFENTTAIDKYLRDHNINVEFVTSFNSDACLLAAERFKTDTKLADKNGFAVEILTNKIKQRQIFKNCDGFSNPSWQKVSTTEDLNEFNLGRVVVKKAVSAGSRDVFIGNLGDKPSFLAIVEDAINRDKGHDWIIEDFVEGTEHTCEGAVSDGELVIFKIFKKRKVEGSFKVSDQLIATYLDDAIFSKLQNALRSFFKEVKNFSGLIHFEFILTENGELAPVEIAGRGGGFGVSETLVSYLCGLNIPKVDLGLQLGHSISELFLNCQLNQKFKSGGVRFLNQKPHLDRKNGDVIFESKTQENLTRIELFEDPNIKNIEKDTDGDRTCSIMHFASEGDVECIIDNLEKELKRVDNGN